QPPKSRRFTMDEFSAEFNRDRELVMVMRKNASADSISRFSNHDLRSCSRQLTGDCQAGDAGPDDRDVALNHSPSRCPAWNSRFPSNSFHLKKLSVASICARRANRDVSETSKLLRKA